MTDTSQPLTTPTFPIIFAAPSGAGKTTIARELSVRREDVEFSISATTRPPRPGERDGVDYFFRSEAEFRDLIAGGQLLEWAEVHGKLYGTPRVNLEHAGSRGHFLLLDVDVQGSRQIKAAVPEAVSIFVLPPTGAELARRLMGRASEDQAVQRRRLQAARQELSAALEFDFLIINQSVPEAADAVEQIMAAESLRTSRADGLEPRVASLIAGVDAILKAKP
ncbi:MAG: guanylate kinase [Gemmatimonadota bacterium]